MFLRGNGGWQGSSGCIDRHAVSGELRVISRLLFARLRNVRRRRIFRV